MISNVPQFSAAEADHSTCINLNIFCSPQVVQKTKERTCLRPVTLEAGCRTEVYDKTNT